jgi:hypothetical protein
MECLNRCNRDLHHHTLRLHSRQEHHNLGKKLVASVPTKNLTPLPSLRQTLHKLLSYLNKVLHLMSHLSTPTLIPLA